MSFNIAIDGPAGAGKSTIAKMIAAKLKFIYVDTGALYRAIALYLIENEIDTNNEEEVKESLTDIEISIKYIDGTQIVLLNGRDVNSFIREERVGKMASLTSKYPCVREKLLDLQRSIAKKENVIMDGRDIGTCVLPKADVKIFLTASSKTRAKRRYDELIAKGIECDIDIIEKDIIARDEQDMNREIAPLKQAEDAIYTDTSDMSIDEVVDYICRCVSSKM